MALHTGAAVGLLLGLPADLRGVNPPLIALASVPAGVAGLALERRIEARLGTPATIATGLVAGGIALGLADRAAEARGAEEATYVDGLWLGIAQAVALVPGVSRNGATLAAARWRRFRRADAARLSRQLAWPVILGATALKAWRLRQDELGAHGTELTAAALTSSLSTLLAVRFFADAEGERPLLPYAVYRVALGTVALIRLSQRTADR